MEKNKVEFFFFFFFFFFFETRILVTKKKKKKKKKKKAPCDPRLRRFGRKVNGRKFRVPPPVVARIVLYHDLPCIIENNIKFYR